MRVVNLARRPFVNRRPIFRFAVLLWLAGALLLAWNVRLYSGHWQGTAENRRLLSQAQERLETARRSRDQLAGRLGAVDLGEQNRQAAFLNALIAYRTFPWSPLFDDLEEVLPADVKLLNVQPVVRLATEVARENRRAALRRAAEERTATRRQGRTSRSPRGAAAEDRNRAAAVEEAPERPEEPELAPDEVGLRLNGLAKTEQALVELVDRLFENPSFRRPVLDSEAFDPGQRATVFSLSVVYLTHRPGALAAPAVAAEGATGATEEIPSSVMEGEPAAAEAPPAPDAPPGTSRAEAVPSTAQRQPAGIPAADREEPDRGALEPEAPGLGVAERAAAERETADNGPPATEGETPAAGMPPAGGYRTLAAGAPAAGAPAAAPPPGEAPVTTPGARPEGEAPAAAPPPGEAPAATPPGARQPGEGPPSDTADRSPPAPGAETRRPDQPREGEAPAGGAASEEPSLGERDASAPPGIGGGGGKLRLVPAFRRPATPGGNGGGQVRLVPALRRPDAGGVAGPTPLPQEAVA